MKRAKGKSSGTVRTKVKKAVRSKSATPAVKPVQDVRKLVQLFQVNLVELEHQNEELRIAEQELEKSRNRYVNLFDFSPIPYLSLDPGGIIEEVNLRAGKMLGTDRNKLIGKNISAFIPFEERKAFDAFVKSIFTFSANQSHKTTLLTKDKHLFHVLLEGVKVDDALEAAQRCQIAVIDLTEYTKLEDSFEEISAELRLLKAAAAKS